MRALVVYESMFGNTRTIAEAIAAGLAERFEVTLTEVGEAPHRVPGDVGLLVVGGPTHAFGLSRSSTRRDAGKQAGGPDGLVSPGLGIREWLGDLEPHPGLPAATFDTHIDKRFPGSAAGAAKKRLQARGYSVRAAESFHVTDTRGPLSEGEEARARTWAKELAGRLVIATGGV
jgi:flavodoxin